MFEQARASICSVIAQLFLWRCVAVKVPVSRVARMVMYAWCFCLLGHSEPYPVTEEGAKWLITCCKCLWYYSSGRLKRQAAAVEFGKGKLLCWSARVLNCASSRKSRVTWKHWRAQNFSLAWGVGGAVGSDPEATYKLCLILKSPLRKSCQNLRADIWSGCKENWF